MRQIVAFIRVERNKFRSGSFNPLETGDFDDKLESFHDPHTTKVSTRFSSHSEAFA